MKLLLDENLSKRLVPFLQADNKTLAYYLKPVILRAQESWLDGRCLCKQGEESLGFIGQSAR
jgi:hypothetical protein